MSHADKTALPLGWAVYTPDGRSYTGRATEVKIWLVNAARRGLTETEIAYFTVEGRITGEERFSYIDTIISRKLDMEPGTFQPQAHSIHAKRLDPLPLPGSPPLAYKELSRNMHRRFTGNLLRDRLDVKIVPSGDQSQATQSDLVSTVMFAATAIQKETGSSAVYVHLYSHEDIQTRKDLASAFYTPDGKGPYEEASSGEVWEIYAAERGFTEKEIAYITLWQRTLYSNLDPAALDAEISRRIGVKPGTVRTSHYMMELLEY
jgi:hypothetical protein